MIEIDNIDTIWIRIRVSSLKRKFTTLLLNFFSRKSSNNLFLITIVLTCNIISLPKSPLLPFHRHQYHPSITWNHADQSFRSNGPQYRQVIFFFPPSLDPPPPTHFTAIESWSNTRALFCLAISPRESLMRDNIGQAVLSRLTAFIRPEIARETTNNCAVYQ